MQVRSIKDFKNLSGKKVLVRVDFNVPLKKKEVSDDFKIKKSLATIKYLVKQKAKVILVSHLGRPTGYDQKFSLKPVSDRLSLLLNKKIKLLDVRKWEELEEQIEAMRDSGVTLLDNIRFINGEENNDQLFSKKLAGLADIFILDGFAVSHRKSSSVSGIANYLPSYAGLLLSEEIESLSKILEKPKKPFVVILGGAKMETKIPVLKNLLSKADYILLGGGIVNTYLWAKGYKVGDSLISKGFKNEALRYCSKNKIILPTDLIVGDNKGKHARAQKINGQFKVKKGFGIYDIGPETIKLYSKYIKSAQTLVWNGAMGYFEKHPYEYGTYSIARLVAARSKGKTFGVCGGGETVEVLKELNLIDDIDFVSTGGGAMLDFLSGGKMPGVEAVKNKSIFLKLFNRAA